MSGVCSGSGNNAFRIIVLKFTLSLRAMAINTAPCKRQMRATCCSCKAFHTFRSDHPRVWCSCFSDRTPPFVTPAATAPRWDKNHVLPVSLRGKRQRDSLTPAEKNYVLGTYRAACSRGTFQNFGGRRKPSSVSARSLAENICCTHHTITHLLTNLDERGLPKPSLRLGAVPAFSEGHLKLLRMLVSMNLRAGPDRIATRFTELCGLPVTGRHVTRLLDGAFIRVKCIPKPHLTSFHCSRRLQFCL